MPTKVNFTKRVLDAFPPSPITKRSYLYDEKVQGLALAVTPAGTKTFVVYRWVQGRPERIRLGRYPDLTIEQARGLAGRVNADIAQGKNPNDRRRWDRAELTLEVCFQEYLERHAYRKPTGHRFVAVATRLDAGSAHDNAQTVQQVPP